MIKVDSIRQAVRTLCVLHLRSSGEMNPLIARCGVGETFGQKS
jgi:hypothetical protein